MRSTTEALTPVVLDKLATFNRSQRRLTRRYSVGDLLDVIHAVGHSRTDQVSRRKLHRSEPTRTGSSRNDVQTICLDPSGPAPIFCRAFRSLNLSQPDSLRPPQDSPDSAGHASSIYVVVLFCRYIVNGKRDSAIIRCAIHSTTSINKDTPLMREARTLVNFAFVGPRKSLI
jgi:hypothetical protein